MTIPKKEDRAECSNYRTIALVIHLSKMLLLMTLEMLKAALEPCLSDEQGGFRKDRSTVHQIRLIWKHLELYKRHTELTRTQRPPSLLASDMSIIEKTKKMPRKTKAP